MRSGQAACHRDRRARGAPAHEGWLRRPPGAAARPAGSARAGPLKAGPRRWRPPHGPVRRSRQGAAGRPATIGQGAPRAARGSGLRHNPGGACDDPVRPRVRDGRGTVAGHGGSSGPSPRRGSAKAAIGKPARQGARRPAARRRGTDPALRPRGSRNGPATAARGRGHDGPAADRHESCRARRVRTRLQTGGGGC